MNNQNKKRSSFTSGIGFVLAASGSAVGLGNLWRFPYLVAQYGGGIFILIYIILALTFGFTLMTTEISIGRKTLKSPGVAYREIHPKFGFLGYFATLVPIIILPYYCVIGGWVIKYMITFISGMGLEAAADDYFSNFIATPVSPLLFFVIFLAATTVIILLGVNKGIEKISSILMPLLVVLSIVICIFCDTDPRIRQRDTLLSASGSLKVQLYDALLRHGTDLLFHGPGHGDHGHVRILYKTRDQLDQICEPD